MLIIILGNFVVISITTGNHSFTKIHQIRQIIPLQKLVFIYFIDNNFFVHFICK